MYPGDPQAEQKQSTGLSENPHSLGKQIAGLSLWSVVFFFFGGLLTVLAGIFTFCDAWAAGIYKKKDGKSVLNISPMGWGVAMEGLLLVAYPLYLINRNKLKTKPGKSIWLVLAMIFGALNLLMAGIWAVTKLSGASVK